MKADLRRFEILALIERFGTVRIQDLADRFDVTEMTVRRDLDRLHSLGFIKRVHGGAEVTQNDNVLFHITLNGRNVEFKEEKQQIGALAAQFVEENEMIFIHGGTTTYELARNLPRDKYFQVVTNSAPILGILWKYENIDVLSTGGSLNHISGTFFGPHADSLIEKLNFDTLFMGSSGVSLEKGLTEFDMYVASLKTKIIDKAGKKILLVDSHKFDILRNIVYSPIEAFNIVVTDANVDPGIVSYLEARDIRVVTP
jgi:DeoR/GlpR family transcriptional regulator of sugar metabolism